MIVIAVDDDLEIIGVEARVAPHESRRHATRAGRVVHLGADVQRLVVEEEAHLRALRGGLSLVRVELGKLSNWQRRSPCGLA